MNRRAGRSGLAPLAAACLLFGLAACASDPHLGPIPGAFAPEIAVGPYRIQPGDELEIRFFHTPEQNVTLPVRPDGMISLPLVYELAVAGRTVEEVRAELVERCSRELAEPEIAVIVRSFTGYMVHVGGEVNRPGVLQLAGPRTVLQAVFEAGGFLPSASPADVLVVRRANDGTYELVAADLTGVLAGENASGNFQLRPFDVVFVPTSPIADVNKWVDLYLRKNLPFNMGLTYRLNPDDN
jgi:protein involved in polysaccharide export with SLBB domain